MLSNKNVVDITVDEMMCHPEGIARDSGTSPFEDAVLTTDYLEKAEVSGASEYVINFSSLKQFPTVLWQLFFVLSFGRMMQVTLDKKGATQGWENWLIHLGYFQ